MARAPQDASEASERRWLQAAARGDRSAFEALYERFERPVYRYIVGLLGNADAAQDVLADTMLDVWRCAARYGGVSRPSTWIFAIAHHKAIDCGRRRKTPTLALDELARVPDPSEPPDDIALRGFEAHEVALALGELRADHRAVIELAFGHGYGYREIAAIVGAPAGTIKSRVFHARKHLQAILERRGVQREVS